LSRVSVLCCAVLCSPSSGRNTATAWVGSFGRGGDEDGVTCKCACRRAETPVHVLCVFADAGGKTSEMLQHQPCKSPPNAIEGRQVKGEERGNSPKHMKLCKSKGRAKARRRGRWFICLAGDWREEWRKMEDRRQGGGHDEEKMETGEGKQQGQDGGEEGELCNKPGRYGWAGAR
jgi:hypothetical protein